MKNSEKTQVITINLNGKQLTFSDQKRLATWVKEEAASWEWVSEYIHTYKHRNVEAIRTLIECESVLNASPLSDKMLSSIQDKIETAINSDEYLFSGSLRGKFINNIKLANAELAAGIFAYFCKLPFESIDESVIEAIAYGILFKKGITKSSIDQRLSEIERARSEAQSLLGKLRIGKDNFDSQLKLLTETHGKYRLALENCYDLINTEREQLHVAYNNDRNKEIEKNQAIINNAVTAMLDEINILRAKIEENLEGFKSKKETELSNFVKSQMQAIVLQSPVRYWEDNAKSHHSSARKYFAALISLGPILVGGLTWLVWHAFSNELINWSRVGVLITLSSFIIWFIRIMIRLYLSHVHLETNANERVVMTKTYLSFIEAGASIDSEEKKVIMEALFRTAATGIIADDGAPHTLADAITKLRLK